MDYILYVDGGPAVELLIDEKNLNIDCDEKQKIIKIITEEGSAFVSADKFIALIPKE
ncbi:MAG: hypothetical protein HGA77_04815 [Chlorobiaceae bacterium]|nr:hypothetical protein [Chlorobiaceae bacterium]